MTIIPLRPGPKTQLALIYCRVRRLEGFIFVSMLANCCNILLLARRFPFRNCHVSLQIPRLSDMDLCSVNNSLERDSFELMVRMHVQLIHGFL